MDNLRNIEISENTLLISHPQPSSWVKSLKNWALGAGAVTFSITTALSVAIINNWKRTGTFSLQNGIDDFVQNPPLFINPEITTTVLVTSAYKAIEKSFADFIDKDISKINKFKSITGKQILGVTLIATNEIFKKINKDLTTSSSIDSNIFDDLLSTVALTYGKEISVVIMLKAFELWVKQIKGFDFYSVGAPILTTIGYVLLNSFQTLYELWNNDLSLENFFKTFILTFTENTVNGSLRIVASSLMYVSLFNNEQANDEMTNVIFDENMTNEINGNAEQLSADTDCEVCEDVISSETDLSDNSLSESVEELYIEPLNPDRCVLTV